MATLKNTLTIDAVRLIAGGSGLTWDQEKLYVWELWLDEAWEDQL
jgi:hypothetical protein